jgi:hypothetical protein
MALEITGDIQLSNGLSLSSCYGRTKYNMNDSSSNVVILVDYWIDENAYSSENSSIQPNFNILSRYEYNRDVDGVDVLSFTQNKIKEQLEELGLSVVITEL